MVAEVQFEIKGLRELGRTLDLFPQKIRDNILELSLMAGARLLAKEARKRAPVNERRRKRPKDGITLAESPVARRNLRIDKRVNTVYVAHRGGRRRLAHIIELGRRPGVSKNGRRFPGMRARPYLRPTVSASGADAIRKTAETMRRKIPNTARQLAGSFDSISRANRRRL